MLRCHRRHCGSTLFGAVALIGLSREMYGKL